MLNKGSKPTIRNCMETFQLHVFNDFCGERHNFDPTAHIFKVCQECLTARPLRDYNIDLSNDYMKAATCSVCPDPYSPHCQCVYLATYPSGLYIGQGKLSKQRTQHMNGKTHIGKHLNEKAISFKVFMKGPAFYCKRMENRLIKHYLDLGIPILNRKL